MHTWIRDTPAHPTVPALQLITNGVPGPTVAYDNGRWIAADGTQWEPTGHIQPGPHTASTDVEVCQILPDGQIPGQTALFD